MSEVLLPRALQAGDAVAVVSPSGPVTVDTGARDRLDAGVATLRRWGFEPVTLDHALDVRGHLAGTDEARAGDLNRAFRDPDLRAVWATRGGSGLGRIVDRLDWAAMRADPKPIVGMSDVTTLLHAAWHHARLITFHGQVASRLHLLDQHADASTHLRGLLTGEAGCGTPLALEGVISTAVVAGVAQGRLLGGNLAVTCAGIGTPEQLDLAGAVWFLEEVNEPGYRLDRMLTQLRRSGVLAGVAGVIVGALVGCEQRASVASVTASEVVAERLGDLGVPVLTDLPIGHTDRHLALPHGATVRLDAGARALELRTAPVV